MVIVIGHLTWTGVVRAFVRLGTSLRGCVIISTPVFEIQQRRLRASSEGPIERKSRGPCGDTVLVSMCHEDMLLYEQ